MINNNTPDNNDKNIIIDYSECSFESIQSGEFTNFYKDSEEYIKISKKLFVDFLKHISQFNRKNIKNQRHCHRIDDDQKEDRIKKILIKTKKITPSSDNQEFY